MGSIITKYSSVLNYIESVTGTYSLILNRTNDIKTRIEKLYNEVLSDLDSINKQILRARRLYEDIQVQVNKYRALMEEAALEVERCQERINYVLSHPITKTYTDDEGNSYTVQEIDAAALAAAENAKATAEEEYRRCRNYYERAKTVMEEIASAISRYETIKNAIDQVAQMLQGNLYEVKKYVNIIENESQHNLGCLNGAAQSLGFYLTSKAINIPSVSTYSDYSSSGGGGYVSSSSSSYLGGGSREIKSTFNEVGAEGASGSGKGTMSPYSSAKNSKEVSERYFNKQSKKDGKGLEYSDIRYLQEYLNNNDSIPMYRKINGHLVTGDEMSPYIEKAITSMTNTISKHELKQDMVLYRGMNCQNAERIFGKMRGKSLSDLKKQLEGINYIERGFSSTSIFEKDALNYCGFNGVLFVINAPKGAEGLFTNKIANYVNTEHEVLLQRGGVFSIDNVSACRDYYIINVTLIGRHISGE